VGEAELWICEANCDVINVKAAIYQDDEWRLLQREIF